MSRQGRQWQTRGERDRRYCGAVEECPRLEEADTPQARGARGLKIKPPQFDGKGTLEAFLAQFRVAAMGNSWTEAEKGLHLAAALTGTANEVLASLDVTTEGGYQRLVEELKTRYYSTPRACQRQLVSRRWEKNESIRTLGDDILRLTCRAHPDLPKEVREEIAESYFLASLTDESTRRFVLLSRPQTYQGHVTAAIEAQPVEVPKSLPRPVLAVQTLKPPEEGGGRTNYRDKPRTGGERPRGTLKCWLCAGPHVQRFCPEYLRLKENLSPTKRGAAMHTRESQ